MKKILIAVLSLMLCFCCMACSQTDGDPAASILSLQDVADLEDSYGLSQEELMDRLSITEADLEYRDEVMMVLAEKQMIHDLPYAVIYEFSTQDPTGLYLVHYAYTLASDQKESATETYDALSEEASGVYGEPSQGPIKNTSTVDGTTGEGITTKWSVGEQSSFTLSYAEQPDGIYLQLTYRFVIPGSIHDLS